VEGEDWSRFDLNDSLAALPAICVVLTACEEPVE